MVMVGVMLSEADHSKDGKMCASALALAVRHPHELTVQTERAVVSTESNA